MALDSGYWESDEPKMTMDEVGALLVKLYADYQSYYGKNKEFATAVAIAIRMLSD